MDQHFATRLDVLLYAHDGRGLGHASRAIGIGMAIRRLYPNLRVLFVTGASISQSLIGNSGLDWIKLPAYASQIVDGISTGIDGPANFSKYALAKHRSAMLGHIISIFKPGVVLVDHSPLGKRKELLEALEISKDFETKWILGLRAVVGIQKSFWSDEYRDIFQKYYKSILWYGDSDVLGQENIERIARHFGKAPQETGYVSRLYESLQLFTPSRKKYTGTVSIPWLGENGHVFIENLRKALAARDKTEQWKIFIHKSEVQNIVHLFGKMPNCFIEAVGESYTDVLLNSKIAIVYGGYNSLMDTFAADIPAIVVMRDMKDKEQELHINQLLKQNPKRLIMVEEEGVGSKRLGEFIERLMQTDKDDTSINILGSENSAKYLQRTL